MYSINQISDFSQKLKNSGHTGYIFCLAVSDVHRLSLFRSDSFAPPALLLVDFICLDPKQLCM